MLDLPGFPVPRDMVGQPEWYGMLPRQIGPMAFGQAGMVEMLTIGAPTRVSPNIDPIQTFLNASFPIDITGMWFDLSADILGAIEAVNSATFPGVEPAGTPVVVIPRGAVFRSGLAKRITAPVLPVSFGVNLMETFTESTQRWKITGITKDSAGNFIAGCRVIAMKSDRMTTVGVPIEADVISDVDGSFSIEVGNNNSFQLIGYLPGSPDVAGITVNTVVPVVI